MSILPVLVHGLTESSAKKGRERRVAAAVRASRKSAHPHAARGAAPKLEPSSDLSIRVSLVVPRVEIVGWFWTSRRRCVRPVSAKNASKYLQDVRYVCTMSYYVNDTITFLHFRVPKIPFFFSPPLVGVVLLHQKFCSTG